MGTGLFSAFKRLIRGPQREEEPETEGEELFSPMTGELIPLAEVPDEVFSSGVLGSGAAILPADGRVYAPADAKVVSIPASGHAIGLLTSQGMEILLHVGINTVELEGKPFTVHVREGDRVQKGDLLLTADLAMITEAGYRTCTPVLVANSDEYESVGLVRTGAVCAGERILAVK